MPESRDILERVFRQEAGVVQGALFAQVHDLDLVEDAFQDAVAAALEHWPGEGVPRRPGAWLLTTARRKALDRLRRRATRLDKQEALALEQELAGVAEAVTEDEEIPDERLRLIVTCCHPELARQAQVALTLRTLGGLSTVEIARAFLVDESAKARLREAGVAYQVPPLEQLPERRESVLAVLYLIFNEGYAATAGDALVRRELCAEAIRLAQVLAQLVHGDTKVRGLLALMLLHDARRDARVGADGVAVALEDQDRTRWDRAQIEAGLALLAGLGTWHRAGPYELQARIGALAANRYRKTTRTTQDVDLLLVDLGPGLDALSHRAIRPGLLDPDPGSRRRDHLQADRWPRTGPRRHRGDSRGGAASRRRLSRELGERLGRSRISAAAARRSPLISAPSPASRAAA